MTIRVQHRFAPYIPDGIRILIIGTFNPDVPCNKAHFYYSRPQNQFWRILPEVFNHHNLKKATEAEKQHFLSRHLIGLADIVRVVEVEAGRECNYSDQYIDSRVMEWNSIETIIQSNPSLEQVVFSRKTFNVIPHIEKRLQSVKAICSAMNIQFSVLPTPTRGITTGKLHQWKTALRNYPESGCNQYTY